MDEVLVKSNEVKCTNCPAGGIFNEEKVGGKGVRN